MKILYAPWRSSYVHGMVQGKTENTTQQECIFCNQITLQEDEKHFIFRRFNYNIIMLNIFPYNAGHLLIVSLEHTNCLTNSSKAARIELIELTHECITILNKALKADGINVGINLGKAAGAGIPSHLHEHVLPRWTGDTNFLPLLAETKQISVDLKKLYRQLKPYFEAISL
jgi:ATP adenylyltransferase